MISDDELLLYYYRDGLNAADRERIAKALGEQPELATRLHRLVARLDAVAAAPEAPVPDHVKQRWHAALDRAAADEMSTTGKTRNDVFARFRWHLAAAALAGVILSVTLSVRMQSAPDAPDEGAPTLHANAPAASESSRYARGLRLHLASTESQLASLDRASADERSQLIDTIIAQNRLYAIAAERANEPQLAGALRAFTPILERLADDRSDDAADEIAQLTFELNVIQARLAAATSNKSSAQSLAL